MKTLKLIGITIISIMLMYACEKQDDEITSTNDVFQKDNNKLHKGNVDGHLVLPFKSHFFTKRDYTMEEKGPTYCTEDPFLSFNYQVGEGEGTHLGHFTVVIQFCGANFGYNNVEGMFIAANGDKLYLAYPEGTTGQVIPYEDPFYEAYFKDPFIFTGGTGRFEGASGGGMTNSNVDLFDDEGNFIAEHQTDHKWNGTLILRKK